MMTYVSVLIYMGGGFYLTDEGVGFWDTMLWPYKLGQRLAMWAFEKEK